MKNETTIKYPHSANLFKFCRRVLDHKFGGARVIDQDVGQILGFDPADCSHWKKGKKNIRSIQAVKSISDHLGIDEKLVVDVASGELGEEEAYLEFSGYGFFTVDQNIIDTAKKEYYRAFAGTWSKDKEVSFKNYFQTDTTLILDIVQKIQKRIDYNEAPLYLPELVAAYPDISLKPQKPSHQSGGIANIASSHEGGKFEIQYTAGNETRPYMRYLLTKAIAKYFLPNRNHENRILGEYAPHMQEVESNIFTSHLLVPNYLLRKEIKNADPARDLIAQLAESFWVSKSFINRRIKDFFEES